MATVRLKSVAKDYPGGVRAVHGVDLAIDDGEFLILVGPSGCGKSTLLTRMALTDIRHGLACIFIDPKGDTIDDIYSRLTKEERNRVIIHHSSKDQIRILK